MAVWWIWNSGFCADIFSSGGKKFEMTSSQLVTKMSTIRWRAKATALAAHLGISGAIFVVLFCFIYFDWYPQPFFEVDGGWQGLRLVFAIDVVLGPLLTFIIFNPNKSGREITFDLSMIAVAQIVALSWGVYTVHRERPIAAVEIDGAFYPTTAEVYAEQGVPLEKVYALSPSRPALVYLRFKSLRDNKTIDNTPENHNIPIYGNFERFGRLDDGSGEAFVRQLDGEKLKSDPKWGPQLKNLQANSHEDIKELAFMPFYGRYGEAILAFKQDGTLVGSLR